jgi:cytosine/adenosine deaminase-related metal-dependent hydrolase
MLRCNATILAMESADEPPMRGDISIAGDRIAAIAPDLEPGDGEEVIDATGCLLIPGLVDTHRHMWEGILRGARHRGHPGLVFPPCAVQRRIVRGAGCRRRTRSGYRASRRGTVLLTLIVDTEQRTHTNADLGLLR